MRLHPPKINSLSIPTKNRPMSISKTVQAKPNLYITVKFLVWDEVAYVEIRGKKHMLIYSSDPIKEVVERDELINCKSLDLHVRFKRMDGYKLDYRYMHRWLYLHCLRKVSPLPEVYSNIIDYDAVRDQHWVGRDLL